MNFKTRSREKVNSSVGVRAAALLAMIHINSGQSGVGKFMETIGFKLNDVNSIFEKADAESIMKSRYTKSRSKVNSNQDKQFYDPGHF